MGTELQLYKNNISGQEKRTPSAVKARRPLSQELCQQTHTIKQPLPSILGNLLTQFKPSQYFQPMAARKVTSAPTWQTRVFHQRMVRAQSCSQREVMVPQLGLGNAVWGDANRCCMPSSGGGSCTHRTSERNTAARQEQGAGTGYMWLTETRWAPSATGGQFGNPGNKEHLILQP